jgi:hypothetical protein
LAIIKGFPSSTTVCCGGFPAKRSSELNHDTVEELIGLAATTSDWSFRHSLGDTMKEKCDSFISALMHMSNTICRKGGQGLFWIVAPPEVLNIIDNISFRWSNEAEHLPLGSADVIEMGILARYWKVYCDQYMPTCHVLVGVGGYTEVPERYGVMKITDYIV